MFVSQELIGRIRTFVSERGGLYFKDHDLNNLQSAIESRMKDVRVDSVVSYYNLLTLGEKKEEEFCELLNILTINHTYFFRNEVQFKALREKVLPELLAKKRKNNDKNLYIWSAGCSTGEEPYTIAMVLKDIIPDIDEWNVKILASDVSTKSLSSAKTALYGNSAVKYTKKYYVDRYFSEIHVGREKKYALSDEIKKMVDFKFFNLMDESFPFGFDIIFCRNVFIYFQFETMLSVLNKFHSSLNDNGSLFIGYSETAQFMTGKFKMNEWEEAIYYTKSTGRKETEEDSVSQILTRLSAGELEAEKQINPREENFNELLVDMLKQMHKKNYDTVHELAEKALLIKKDSIDPLFISSEAFINQGNFEQAKINLDNIVKLNPMFAPAYCLIGSIYYEKGDFEAAKSNFKKSLYIDEKFPLAHFYLAMIYRNEGGTLQSIREFRNTIKALSSVGSGDIVPYSGGMFASTLLGVCTDNIERLKV